MLVRIISFFLNASIVLATTRRKRIINGGILSGRFTGYEAPRYYTWISNGHECDLPAPEFVKNWFGLHEKWEFPTSVFGFQCQPTPDRLWCSGALITPKIVQTACHCLADFEIAAEKSTSWYGKIKSVWETMYKVYLGVNSVDLMNWGIPPQSYFIHEKCGGLMIDGLMLLHDYAWISLAKNVDHYANRLHLQSVDFAPTYNMKELARMWRYTMSKSLVCLYIGFGGFQLMRDQESSEKSSLLLHTWHYTMSYSFCRSHLDLTSRIRAFNYSKDATWICTDSFMEGDEGPGHGDSGGPVTCDNQYVAVTSQQIPYGGALAMAIAFAVFQNAAEYRRAFMNAIEFNRNHGFNIPTLLPTEPIY